MATGDLQLPPEIRERLEELDEELSEGVIIVCALVAS